MDKLEQLSNIRSGDVNISQITDFFETIKNVKDIDTSGSQVHVVKSDNLREDVVMSSNEEEKALIIENFPAKQGTYLVVPKVIQ
ncbi:MAG: aspartyl/glutamyl-tRNA(Asn/Gln) amidotransferase C subunit [Saprospiraceae bacterium]|jgi:aspartyl/glutamyl-tRNA(Asn/Gln) amidotransferase C subunit